MSPSPASFTIPKATTVHLIQPEPRSRGAEPLARRETRVAGLASPASSVRFASRKFLCQNTFTSTPDHPNLLIFVRLPRIFARKAVEAHARTHKRAIGLRSR